MFSYIGRAGNRYAPVFHHRIFQFEEGIIVFPIAIDNNADHGSIVSFNGVQPFKRIRLDSAEVDRHTD